MKIEILGHGGGFSLISTSYLIEDNIMVDCGQGVVNNLIHNDRGDTIDNLKKLFITHVHADHINGLETLLYYKFIRNNLERDNEFTIYGTQDVYDYFVSTGFAKGYGKTGEVFQPFNFEILPTNGGSTIMLRDDEELFANYVSAEHMQGAIKNLVYIFVKKENNIEKKVIITGDMDNVHPLISKEMIHSNAILFHDMGWTNVHGQQYVKVHPTEEEVYKKYGDMDNIIGIHTEQNLKRYKQAQIGDIYII